MPERVIEHLTLILYAIAAISGGLGGCAMAGQSILRGGPSRASYFIAYAMLGVLFGMLVASYGALFGIDTLDVQHLIGASVIAGAGGSVALASANLSARILLKRLGIEVQVNVKRTR